MHLTRRIRIHPAISGSIWASNSLVQALTHGRAGKYRNWFRFFHVNWILHASFVSPGWLVPGTETARGWCGSSFPPLDGLAESRLRLPPRSRPLSAGPRLVTRLQNSKKEHFEDLY